MFHFSFHFTTVNLKHCSKKYTKPDIACLACHLHITLLHLLLLVQFFSLHGNLNLPSGYFNIQLYSPIMVEKKEK